MTLEPTWEMIFRMTSRTLVTQKHKTEKFDKRFGWVDKWVRVDVCHMKFEKTNNNTQNEKQMENHKI